ncbi:Histidine kinase [Dyadobacter soli]|uniref:Histidine kinase n=1 Tax=Dyadobacter soli TaxID=659014 RepID=A0A1G7MJG9_9BACT|nr:sensor histidine kinase [Dyadobacter soli]SDF61814.1 Histidine kinase [Dyadobacter soli]
MPSGLVVIAYHLAYFIPAFGGELPAWRLVNSYFIYYLRFIPVFYAGLWLFQNLRSGDSLVRVLSLTMLGLVTVMHLASTFVYWLLDKWYGLGNLSEAFKKLGSLYLKEPSMRSWQDWLVFGYDLQELQLLLFPVGLKMLQYGLSEGQKKAAIERQQIETELRLLKSQLEPHFIYNVLLSAYASVVPVSGRAAGYLNRLAGLLRYTLYETSSGFVPLKKELASLRNYLKLETLRYGRRLNIKWEQSGPVAGAGYIPTLVLISLAENAVKHSADAHTGPSQIHIKLEATEQELHFTITNNKPARAVKRPRQGLGLPTIERRLAMLYEGVYPYQFEIRQNQLSYGVVLRIPILVSI